MYIYIKNYFVSHKEIKPHAIPKLEGWRWTLYIQLTFDNQNTYIFINLHFYHYIY